MRLSLVQARTSLQKAVSLVTRCTCTGKNKDGGTAVKNRRDSAAALPKIVCDSMTGSHPLTRAQSFHLWSPTRWPRDACLLGAACHRRACSALVPSKATQEQGMLAKSPFCRFAFSRGFQSTQKQHAPRPSSDALPCRIARTPSTELAS